MDRVGELPGLLRAALEVAGPPHRLLVACSGGADSMALLHLLVRVGERWDAAPELAVASLDHGLRGREGAADVVFVEKAARRLGVAFRAGRVEVGEEAGGRSLEEAAREARYRFLDESASRLGCDAIATAHTRDDAAETFLLRLLRGSGRTGLCGLREVLERPGRPAVIRPLLGVSRRDVHAFLERAGIAYRLDPSNEDLRFERNRVRHHVLPLLEATWPGVSDRLARTSQILVEEELYLEREGEAILKEQSRGDIEAGGLHLDRDVWSRAPEALRPRLLRRWLQLSGGPLRGVGSRHLDLIAEALESEGAVDLPGNRRVVADGEGLRLVPEPARKPGEAPATGFCYPSSVPARITTPSGYRVEASILDRVPPREEILALAPHVAVLDAAAFEAGFRLRSRRPGDRIKPLGMKGHSRKLQDILVDRKIPRDLRDAIPVVEIGGEIAWVAGVAVGRDFRLREDSLRALRIELSAPPEGLPAPWEPSN